MILYTLVVHYSAPDCCMIITPFLLTYLLSVSSVALLTAYDATTSCNHLLNAIRPSECGGHKRLSSNCLLQVAIKQHAVSNLGMTMQIQETFYAKNLFCCHHIVWTHAFNCVLPDIVQIGAFTEIRFLALDHRNARTIPYCIGRSNQAKRHPNKGCLYSFQICICSMPVYLMARPMTHPCIIVLWLLNTKARALETGSGDLKCQQFHRQQ